MDLALLDLDSALEVARSAGPSYHAHLERWQSRRGEIANLDAKHVLDMLQRATPNAFVLGNWLNLIARIERDPDIAGLRTTVANQFQAALGRQVDFEITAARQKLESEEVLQSLAHCDRVATLISHLADSRKASVRGEAESMVGRLVRSHGVNIEPLQRPVSARLAIVRRGDDSETRQGARDEALPSVSRVITVARPVETGQVSCEH